MSSYTIRLFERRDINDVVELAAEYAAFDRAMPRDWLLATYEKHPQSVWVAEAGSKVIGFIIGYETTSQTGEIRGDIELLAVHTSYRRTGVGTKLVETILKQFNKANVKEAYLYCPSKALDAKKLYGRLGFKVNAYYMTRRT